MLKATNGVGYVACPTVAISVVDAFTSSRVLASFGKRSSDSGYNSAADTSTRTA